MSLPLTPENLRAAYDFLCTTAPFNKWNLPEGDDVTFKVSRSRTTAALLTYWGDRTELTVSSALNGHTDTLLSSVAHEMIHLHERQCGIKSTGENAHGRAFRKWAAQVCDAHGFDPKIFY